MHGWLSDHYGHWNTALVFGSLLVAVVLLAVVFASDFVQRTTGVSADAFQWTTGIAAIASFLLSLVGLVWQPAAKAASHRQAIGHYTKAKYEVGRQLDSEEDITIDSVRDTEERYLDTRDLPRIPDRRFLKLKRWPREKIAISKELDKNPQESIRGIRNRVRSLRRNIPSSTDEEGSTDEA